MTGQRDTQGEAQRLDLSKMAPKATQWWRWVLGALVSLAVLVALFAQLDDMDRILEAIKQVSPAELGMGCGLFTITCACRWWRVWILVPADRRRPMGILSVSAGHACLNLILPMRTGELTFPVLLKRATGLPLGVGAIYLFTIRILELAVLTLLYTVAASIWLNTAAGSAAAQLQSLRQPLIALSIIALLAIASLPVFIRWLWTLAMKILGSPRLSRVGFFRKISGSLEDGQDTLGRLGTLGVAKLCLATTAMWLSLFGMFHMCMLSFGVEIDFFETVVGSAGAIFANLLPINGLGSFGTLELGWVAGFAATGQQSLGSVAAAGLAMHLLLVLVSGALAVLGFVASRRVAAAP